MGIVSGLAAVGSAIAAAAPTVGAIGAAASPFLQAQGQAGQARRKAGLQERQFGLQERQVGLQERRSEQERRALQDLLKRATGAQETGEQAFLRETGAAIPELAQVRKDILAGSTPAQQRARSGAKLALRQEGVRGPEAALALQQTGAGLQQQLQRQLNQLALGEAERRSGRRAEFFAGQSARGQERSLIPVDPGAAEQPTTQPALPAPRPQQRQGLSQRIMPTGGRKTGKDLLSQIYGGLRR